MANKLVEYKMHKNELGSFITPYFIDDGGYFQNGIKFIGIILSTSQCYIPSTTKDNASSDFIEYTKAEFISQMQTIGLNDVDGVAMSSEDISTFIGNWCDEKGIE